MKRINVIIILLLLSKVGAAQTIPTFSKIFGSDSALIYGGVSITSYGDSIYFSMFEQDLPVTYQATNFIKTNPDGTQSAINRFYKPDSYFSAGFAGSMKVTSDDFLICGGNSGPLHDIPGRGTLYKFNLTNLDTVYLKYFSHGNISLFIGSGQLSDGAYILSGEVEDTSIHGTASAWLVKTDFSGREVWHKTMSSDDYSAAYFSSPFVGGFYQLWITGHPNTPSGNPADSAIFVDKYDNAGNLLWRDTFGVIGHDNGAGPFTALKEGGSVLAINVLDTTGYQYGPTVIYKINSMGTIVWQRYFPRSPMGLVIVSMIETKSGNLILCGEGYGKIHQSDSTVKDGGFVLKLDKFGNLMFYTIYEYDSTQNDIFFDITETTDGGYACIGDAYQRINTTTNYQRAWLLKVDSNGCLNGNCPTLYTGIQTIPDLVSFFVFPNPASSQFTIALAGPEDINRYHDLRFMLYDLTGRVVYSQPITQQTTIIQREGLSDGLYIWELSDRDTHITDGKISFR